MEKDHLIKMANQIGSFFKSYPDQEYAANEIASHMKRFWAPKMRSMIKDIVANPDNDSLDDIVKTAIRKYL
tara:strand:+ start:15607 stop:15819 length:213 start_codon:yes stop_codon:yes gene_type:complete